MIRICVTSHNNNDPECRRLTITRWYEFNASAETLEEFVTRSITANEALLRLSFPKGMTYTVAYSEVEVIDAEDDTFVYKPQEGVPVILGLKDN